MASRRIVRVCLVQSRNLSFESANPEPIDDAFEDPALRRQCSNACFSFLNRAHRLRAMRIDHLWPSLLKLSEQKRQISRLRDRMSVPGKISDYYPPCPALTYDCGHKLSLVSLMRRH